MTQTYNAELDDTKWTFFQMFKQKFTVSPLITSLATLLNPND